MNTNAYIESGMLEAYALGALSPEEQAAVESNITQYPELAEELLRIEETLTLMAEASAKMPPLGMEQKIWAAIGGTEAGARPAGATIPFQPAAANQQHSALQSRQFPAWQRAALWIGLAASVAGNVALWNSRSVAHRERDAYAEQISTLRREKGEMTQQLVTFQEQRAMMMDPGMTRVVMTSPTAGKDMRGAIFLSPDGREAYLALAKMPPPPPGKQYQLWVLKDGKPIDMGVIPNALVEGGTEKMTLPVTGGQAYAISLEREGGSPVPTMEQIQVLGKV